MERYLFEHSVAPVDFLSRLILRGLYHILQSDSAPVYMLNVIADALGQLKAAVK
ncbi:MAG: hypothetical protein PHZ09_08760 [Eubacteriales bacterium]|nr:hypothetical protein [Eubacteriales bacterium]